MGSRGVGDGLDPLRQMCRQGRLFEVQEWIREGKPIQPKAPPPKNARNSPLCIALAQGFHSLAQVLLEAGAPIQEGNYHALHHAVQLRRTDLVALLIKHGANVDDVSMQTVIATWDREMVDLFVSNGASLETDLPIAWGLINKIRTTLGVFKQYVGQQPELAKQVEIALRYHSREGNTKWVSLMLWAGADPWALGPDDAPDYDFRAYDDEHGPLLYAAVELAVTYDRLEVLKLKNFLKPANREPPNAARIFEHAWKLRDPGVVRLLLERGYGPAQREDRCSELLTGLLCILSSSWTSSRWLAASRRPTHDIDTYQSEQVLEIIGLLLAHGALWAPRDQEEIKRVRGSLLKMAPKYTFEFIELLHKHRAGRRGDVEELIRTPKMTKLMQKRCRKIPALVADLPEELAYPVTAD